MLGCPLHEELSVSSTGKAVHQDSMYGRQGILSGDHSLKREREEEMVNLQLGKQS